MTPPPKPDLVTELHSIGESMVVLIEKLDHSLPEERVAQMADAVVAGERTGRKRLMATLVILIIVAGGGWLQSRSNGQTLDEAKTVANYVRNCLQHPQTLTPEQRLVQCGPPSAGTASFIKYFNCALQISQEARTDKNLNECATMAFGG